MKTAYYIAKRYLFSKKSTNAINIISGISMLGVFVGSAALIVILSAFNGLEDLVISLSNTLNPDLVIEPSQGKTFDPGTQQLAQVSHNPKVAIYSEILQEKALLRYDNNQFIGEIKGVSNSFLRNKELKNTLLQGSFILNQDDKDYAVIGSTVQYTLGININDPLRLLEIYSPNRSSSSGFTPADEFVSRYLPPSGVFESNQESDNEVIIPIKVARALLKEPKNISSAEIILKDPNQAEAAKQELQKLLGDNYIVKDRIQQNALLYKILNTEKWAVYLILTFVLVIATFNIVGSLTMLVIDKQKDIAILNSLGANKKMIRQIFLFEGLMISFIGCALGLVFGGIFCFLQVRYGIIAMSQGNTIVDAYPMAIRYSDFILVFITVFVIAFIASFISSRLSVKRFENLKQAL
ncbi:ABC transporter permease [Pedobacter sp. SD-b]|uniref:ABC transporter permease n=1 Tax=Pedobacter segetis TaxID=2793069 RepID=A0ABS1BGK8_9SPHI|nr:FtsX-like permease family protein [Pedobacter segetis]MBK0381988.1 ABC transporter permease [Pedobacter segetis]